MIAHEKIERTKRMPRTTRATQPVCVMRVSSRLSKSISASPEIVSPRKKNLQKNVRNHRSTRHLQNSNYSGHTEKPLCSKRHKAYTQIHTRLKSTEQAGLRCQSIK